MVIIGQVLYQLPVGSRVYVRACDNKLHESLCVYEQPESFSVEAAYEEYMSRAQFFNNEKRTGPGLDTFLMTSSRKPLSWEEFCSSRAEMYVDGDRKNSTGQPIAKVILLGWSYN